MTGFGSDNHSGVHPKILASLTRVNGGHMPAYGTDPVSDESSKMMKEIFGENAEAHYVFNGTAANVLALSALVKPYHAILTSQHSHLINDECGAPEKNLGCKVISVPSPDAKIRPADLKPFLVRRGDQHYSQVRAISITQPTELGTVYTLKELREIAEFARTENLLLHIDGARLVNAAATLNCTLKEMTTDIGADVISLGGTKNGLLFGEAVVFLKPGLDSDFKFTRKQMMQLPSKTRFIAAQFLEFLGTDLWLKNAKHANAMARLLAEGLKKSPYAQITQETEANAVFAILPKHLIGRLRKTAFFYVWDEITFECRLMTSWDTQVKDIESFLSRLDELGRLDGGSNL